jgi:hypothetical protein
LTALPKPPSAQQLAQLYSQEEDADYVATLLILFIEETPLLAFHSVEHEYLNGAKADVASTYTSRNGGLIFEIKSKREMSAVATFEMDKIVKQIIRYSVALTGWNSGQASKDFCDVAEIVHSADIEKFESEATAKLNSLEGQKIRSDGLVFVSWEKVEVHTADDIRMRYYRGALSDGTILGALKTHNGYAARLHRVAAERNTRNIHLEFQSEHRLIVTLMEKIWGIYDFRAGLRRSRTLHSAVNEYFVQKGRIYFTLDCLDFHFHWVPSGRKYSAHVSRSRLGHACEQMAKLDILKKHEIGSRTYYSMSILRKEHDYLSDVCESYAKMLEEEYSLASQAAATKLPQLSLDNFTETSN